MVLLVSNAASQGIREILQIPNPTMTSTTTRNVLVVMRATEKHIVIGGVFKPMYSHTPIDVADQSEKYFPRVQQIWKEDSGE